MADEPVKQPQLSIEIDDATAQGMYCNLAFIAHSEQEFVMDFMFLSPQQPKAKVRSRIITSPKHAKRFMAALMDNIKKFESRFGVIPLDAAPQAGGDGMMYN
jgi:hypothetical protein